MYEVTACSGCGEAYNPLGLGDDVEDVGGVLMAVHFASADGVECGAITPVSGEWFA